MNFCGTTKCSSINGFLTFILSLLWSAVSHDGHAFSLAQEIHSQNGLIFIYLMQSQANLPNIVAVNVIFRGDLYE